MRFACRIDPLTGRSLYILGVFVALVGYFAEQARCTVLQGETADCRRTPPYGARGTDISRHSISAGSADGDCLPIE
jgi:hypothetical protein